MNQIILSANDNYKELFEYFKGDCTLEAALENIKQNSRRYAKRQLTWFRRNDKIHRLNYGEDILTQAENIMEA